jgi:hypothetical protein
MVNLGLLHVLNAVSLTLLKISKMKYLSCCLLVLLSAVCTRAQKIDSAAIATLSPASKEKVNQYLLSAKKAKTTARIMCFGGGALMVAGLVMGVVAVRNDNQNPDQWNPFDSTYTVAGDNALGNTGAVLFWVGTASALGSIPFFIKSHKKTNAARAIVYADKGVSLAPRMVMPGTRSAGIRLIIPIGK